MSTPPPGPAATSPTFAPGVIVGGRYRLGAALGSGGMADVYDGLDLRLERAVAVKLLRPDIAAREDVRSRFEAEARAAAGISHPNAVAVFDTGEHEGVPYLVMERLPGDTLADRIEAGLRGPNAVAGPVETAWLCGAARGVLGALSVAHGAGIVHRDVKPGNILLAADGTAKIADFGIAKSIHPADGGAVATASGRSADLTATGQLLGTPAYLAPERIEGMPASPRSDLWALGVVLYEALAGQKPFTGRGPLDVAHAIVTGEHVPLGERRPDLDPGLVATIERAMALRPEDRFATAGEMATALGGEPGDIVDPTIDERARRDGTLVLPLAPPPPARKRRYGRPGVVWAAVGVVAFLLLLVLVRADRPEGVRAGTQAPPTTTAPAASAPTTAGTQGLAQGLRDLAARLDRAKDGARAADLAASLRRVADAVATGSPGAGAEATAAMITAAAWNQTGQLGNAATASALDLLRQVPGVSVQVQSPPTTAARAPATTVPANAGQPGKGKGKGKD